MMIELLLAANAAIFLVLAMLHIYWAIGGTWALNLVIPVNSNGRKVIKPQSIGTFVIAIVLLLFVVVDLSYCRWIFDVSGNPYIRYGIFFVAILFLLRAIGDFRYVGFSKKYKKTEFAKWDYLLFSPLCLVISISHGLAYWAG